jgi:hypothetical protein
MAAAPRNRRTAYGGNKYAAFHLLLARMFRHHAPPAEVYQYVTLGGTELRDARTVNFIDDRILEGAVSFEEDTDRFEMADAMARRLQTEGPKVQVIQGSLFEGFTRTNTERRHLFFVDFECRCAFSDFHLLFSRMFRRECICVNDLLIVTSFIGGRKPNLRQQVEEEYDPEFRILGIQSSQDKQATFRVCHPSFTLYRGLADAGMQDTLDVNCFGFVAYLDTSPMGVYGYTVGEGQTDIREFVNTPRFELYGTEWRDGPNPA